MVYLLIVSGSSPYILYIGQRVHPKEALKKVIIYLKLFIHKKQFRKKHTVGNKVFVFEKRGKFIYIKKFLRQYRI